MMGWERDSAVGCAVRLIAALVVHVIAAPVGDVIIMMTVPSANS